MAAQKGRAMILKIDKGAATFVTYPGQRETSITVGNETVDITSKDDQSTASALSGALHRRLLDQGGVTSVSISASGVFKDSSHQSYLRAKALKNTTIDCKVVIPGTSNLGADTFNGTFLITSLQENGAYNGEIQYTMSLESASEITITG